MWPIRSSSIAAICSGVFKLVLARAGVRSEEPIPSHLDLVGDGRQTLSSWGSESTMARPVSRSRRPCRAEDRRLEDSQAMTTLVNQPGLGNFPRYTFRGQTLTVTRGHPV